MATNARYAKQDGKIYRFNGVRWQKLWLQRNPDAVPVSARQIQAELLRAARHASTPGSEWGDAPLLPDIPAAHCHTLLLPETAGRPGRRPSKATPPWRPPAAPPFAIPPEHPFAVLSPRELEIAAMVAKGVTNVGIAYALGMTPATVSVYISRMKDKLGCPVAVDRYGGRTYRCKHRWIGGPWVALANAAKAAIPESSSQPGKNISISS